MGLMGLVATSAYFKESSILGIIPRALPIWTNHR
ncbi:hypothetical protein Goari_010328 [Gossypium aridum]|uniref:Uncharacterized protein n=1 Tax=Gossypium aridum TaxID=34290 RepID=A0A7J8XZQ3_GOSAI|nr:hypothetical protein [Gossypium aridum]